MKKEQCGLYGLLLDNPQDVINDLKKLVSINIHNLFTSVIGYNKIYSSGFMR